jgi:hydroxymethylpyrimidine pyrophosphatase-like HAD family hydrolase
MEPHTEEWIMKISREAEDYFWLQTGYRDLPRFHYKENIWFVVHDDKSVTVIQVHQSHSYANGERRGVMDEWEILWKTTIDINSWESIMKFTTEKKVAHLEVEQKQEGVSASYDKILQQQDLKIEKKEGQYFNSNFKKQEQSEVERLREENEELKKWKEDALKLWQNWFVGKDVDPIKKIRELESKLSQLEGKKS